MTSLRTSDFTDTDGNPWPLSSGSWGHSTPLGSFSANTETVLSNRGRVTATTSAAGCRRLHSADTGETTAKNVTASIVRSVVSGLYPGVYLNHAAATDTYYYARIYTDSGKTPSYGLMIGKIVAGSLSMYSSDYTTPGTNVNTTTGRWAMRLERIPYSPTGSGVGDILIGKLWDTAGAEPTVKLTSLPTTDTSQGIPFSESGGVGSYICAYYVASTGVLATGYSGTDEYSLASGLSYTVDWDDFSSSIENSQFLTPMSLPLSMVALAPGFGIDPIELPVSLQALGYSLGEAPGSISPISLPFTPVVLTPSAGGASGAIGVAPFHLEPQALVAEPGVAPGSILPVTMGFNPVVLTPSEGLATGAIGMIGFPLVPQALVVAPSGPAPVGISPLQIPIILVALTPGVFGRFKVWNGVSWEEKPLYWWNGTDWVEKPLKFFDGVDWQLA